MHINKLLNNLPESDKFSAEIRPFAASAMYAAQQADNDCDELIPVNEKFGKNHRAANIILHALEAAARDQFERGGKKVLYCREDVLTALFESIDAVQNF